MVHSSHGCCGHAAGQIATAEAAAPPSTFTVPEIASSHCWTVMAPPGCPESCEATRCGSRPSEQQAHWRQALNWHRGGPARRLCFVFDLGYLGTDLFPSTMMLGFAFY